MNLKRIVKTMNQEYRSSLFYKKVLYSYLLATCVIFLLFTIVLFLLVNKDYSHTLEGMQDYAITQAYNVNQTTLKDIINNCYTILDRAAMNNILYGNNYDNALALEALELHDNIRMASSLVQSVYFINFQTGTILDHSGRTSIDNHIDSGVFEMLADMTPGMRPLFCYPRFIDCNLSGTIRRDVPVLSMAFYSNPAGAMVVNLDYETYCGMLSLNDSEYIDIILVSSAGKVMSASDQDLFGTDYTDNELYRQIQESAENRGSFLYHPAGQPPQSIKYIKNIGLGITYICSLSSMQIYPENSTLSTLLHYSAIYLAIGLTLSFLLSWIIYNPLRQLKTYIAAHPVLSPEESALSDDKSPAPGNDFDYLSQAYRKILNINTDLQQVSHAYMKEQSKKLLKSLLTDASGAFGQYSAELEALNASLGEKNNLILLLGIDSFTSDQSGVHAETSLLKYVVQNVTEELLSSTVIARHIETESPFVIFLLNFNEPNTEEIIRLLQEAQSFILKHYKITFSAGIGDTVEELTELSLSYQSAYEAFSRRFVTGNGSILAAANLRLTPALEQLYPYEISDSLLNAVKSLSPETASRYVHDFVAAIRTYRIEQILFHILQLVTSLQRLELMNYIAADGEWDYKSLEQSTLNAIEIRLAERCAGDIEQLSKTKEADSGKKELIGEIIGLVEDNLYNPDLSVVFLADHVHLSVNYLRNVFKENTGDSLSSYITQKKLALICNLLLNTDMSLSEISDKLGFSTKNYFFTFVKKHTGMTPGDYRKKMKKD
ncbi:helix-turn-helix domain-containing protein [Acetatifactor aquisgranensis]|uniref:helix-turn-helix domain-containing protein n=1 Tax=Acetatifactor aquisgranensis TaxID=2941233 RepID=UPI0020412342|nr:AraC family transcriptional regulator [Acetatifactor aquisgranensis]